MKVIFIDTETTGFDDKRQDIIQVAGLVTENRKILESFNFIAAPVNFNAISKDALNITGKTLEELKTYPDPKLAYNGLKEIFERYVVKGESRYVIAGQNVKSFDWRFLASFWNKHKAKDDVPFEYFFSQKIVYDLMDLTRPLKKAGLLNVPNIKLGTIMEAMGIKPQGNLHDALTDIIGTCDSFYAVTDKWIELSRINPDFVTANMNDNIKHLLAREIKAKAKDNDVYDIM